MKTILFRIVACLFLLHYSSLGFSQRDFDSTLNINPGINAMIDSIKNSEQISRIESGVFFFNIDFSGKNAYGNIILKEQSSMTVQKIGLVSNKKYSEEMAAIRMEKADPVFNDLFSNPESVLQDFFPNCNHALSHDNYVYLFVKVKGKIYFDKRFRRSSFIDTKNNKSASLIQKLGHLSTRSL
jgi:hypothetical protein